MGSCSTKETTKVLVPLLPPQLPNEVVNAYSTFFEKSLKPAPTKPYVRSKSRSSRSKSIKTSSNTEEPRSAEIHEPVDEPDILVSSNSNSSIENISKIINDTEEERSYKPPPNLGDEDEIPDPDEKVPEKIVYYENLESPVNNELPSYEEPEMISTPEESPVKNEIPYDEHEKTPTIESPIKNELPSYDEFENIPTPKVVEIHEDVDFDILTKKPSKKFSKLQIVTEQL